LYSTKLFYSFLSGDIIIFDIFTTRTTVSQVKLTDISQTCINPLNKNIYELIGVVSYKRPMTRNSNIGHYTAICSRMGTWVEYNDLDKKERHIKEKNTMITPAVLIYAKKKLIYSLLLISSLLLSLLYFLVRDIIYARAHPYAYVTRNNTNFAIVLNAL